MLATCDQRELSDFSNKSARQVTYNPVFVPSQLVYTPVHHDYDCKQRATSAGSDRA